MAALASRHQDDPEHLRGVRPHSHYLFCRGSQPRCVNGMGDHATIPAGGAANRFALTDCWVDRGPFHDPRQPSHCTANRGPGDGSRLLYRVVILGDRRAAQSTLSDPLMRIEEIESRDL